MADAQSPRDILAEVVSEGRKVLVPHLAEMLKRSNIAEVTPSEERQRFWQRAMTPEQEQQAWQAEMAQRGLAELTPEQAVDIGLAVSKRVYPGRWDMMTGEGRDTQAQQATWAWKHAKQGNPEQPMTTTEATTDGA